MLYVLLFIIVLYIFIDLNYVIRTFFTVLSGRFYENKCSLDATTTVYGFGTYLDCDITFKYVRVARLIRDLDFARYHFYDRTGVYQRSRDRQIKSLQGCTLTLTMEPVPIFSCYKIITKLVYWDERSLFFEHEVITLSDGKTKVFLVSRQYGLGQVSSGTIMDSLLKGIPGFNNKKSCPEYINHWMESSRVSSEVLRNKVM